VCHIRSTAEDLDVERVVEGGEGRNVKRFRGGLEFKARRLLYHSTLGLRVTKKREGGEGLANQAVLETDLSFHEK